jgi:two-component system, chemotaxis family, protein-glutamate methylesterase/glutaminase
VFGGSAGGLEALIGVLHDVPCDLPATIGIALHRSPAGGSHLAVILGRNVALPVSEPSDGESVKPGHVYLAPTDFHMTIEDERWRLSRGPKMHRMRPAVDPLMISAATARGNRVVGVLLSGGGVDGVEGLIAITAKGGLSIAQQPEQARQPSMPVTAIREDDVDAVLRIDEIAAILPLLAAGRSVEVSRSGRGDQQ